MVTTYFCPRCWYHDTIPIKTCPRCGHDITSDDILTYEERLLSALSHPVREHRMIAIEVLGRIGSGKAVPALEKVIGTESDYYLIREAVKALDRIGGPKGEAIIASLSRHPSSLVRKIARDFVPKDAALSNGDDPGKSP